MFTYCYLLTYDPGRDERPQPHASDRAVGVAEKIIEVLGSGPGGRLSIAEVLAELIDDLPAHYEGGDGCRGIAFSQKHVPSVRKMSEALHCHRDRIGDLYGQILQVERPRKVSLNGRVLDVQQSAVLIRDVRLRLRRAIDERDPESIGIDAFVLDLIVDGEPDLFEHELIEVGRRILADCGG